MRFDVNLKSESFNLAEGSTTSENSRSTFSTQAGYSMPSGRNLSGMSCSSLSNSSASRFNHFGSVFLVVKFYFDLNDWIFGHDFLNTVDEISLQPRVVTKLRSLHSFPAAKFRHSWQLYGATKATIPFSETAWANSPCGIVASVTQGWRISEHPNRRSRLTYPPSGTKMGRVMDVKILSLFIFMASLASAQTNMAGVTNGPQSSLVQTNPAPSAAQHAEQTRAACIQGRRSICGKILAVLSRRSGGGMRLHESLARTADTILAGAGNGDRQPRRQPGGRV